MSRQPSEAEQAAYRAISENMLHTGRHIGRYDWAQAVVLLRDSLELAEAMKRRVEGQSEPHKVISPWAYDQAVREMACFRCQAMPGEPCRTPKGRQARTPHSERTARYRAFIGEEEFNRRHQRGLAVR